MWSEELDRALGETPASFAEKMDATLRGLKEEKEMKRAAFRTVLILALVTVLLCSTAYALVSQGLEWYYNNRFTAYQQYEPERHEAIMNHLQTQVPQSAVNDPDISIGVTDVSWVPEQQVLVVSMAARAMDDTAVLHPMDNLDADGSYVGKGGLALYPDDEEAREEHWLWTEAGFGPVEQMVAPGKQLLLLNAHEVYLDGLKLLGDNSSYDSYVAEDGTVYTVIEIRLNHLDPGYIEEQETMLAKYPEQTFRTDNIAVARKLLSLMESADTMELTIPYTVTSYTDSDDQFYNGGRTGTLAFTVNLK